MRMIRTVFTYAAPQPFSSYRAPCVLSPNLTPLVSSASSPGMRTSPKGRPASSSTESGSIPARRKCLSGSFDHTLACNVRRLPKAKPPTGGAAQHGAVVCVVFPGGMTMGGSGITVTLVPGDDQGRQSPFAGWRV